MAQRNQVETRVRLSAEGQQEVIAAFQKVQQQAEKGAAGTGRAFSKLPTTFAALRSSVLAAFPIAAPAALIGVVTAMLPKVAALIDYFRGLSDSGKEAAEAQVKLNRALTETKDVAAAREKQRQLGEELRQHERTLESLTVKWLPGWAQAAVAAAQGQRDQFIHARDRVEELRKSVSDATDDYFKLRDAAQKAATAQIEALRQEVELLGITGAARVELLHQRQVEIVRNKFSLGELNQQQVNEILNLLNAKRAHDLNAEAAKRHSEELKNLSIQLIKVNTALGEQQISRPTLLRPGERIITPEDRAAARATTDVRPGTELSTEGLEARLSVIQQGAQVFEATRTAAERFNTEVVRLGTLLEEGAIDQDTFNRAMKQAEQDLRVATEGASRYQQALRGLEESLSADNLRADALLSVRGALADFLANGILQAKSFGDAMRGLALSVVRSLQQMAAQALATFIIMRLLRGLFGGFGFPLGFSEGGQVGEGFAAGGKVHGPGSGTSDSIPAWLSRGEFVIREAVVKQPGMLEMLELVNSGGWRLPPLVTPRYGFADGGLVDAIAGMDGGSGGAGASFNGRADLTLDLDDTLLLKRVSANREFDRIVVRVLEKNRKAVNAALGHNAI
jgi:hypothetical protein